MRTISVDESLCIGCHACSRVCPAGLIRLEEYARDHGCRRSIRIPSVCDEDCDRCEEACPEGAIYFAQGPGGEETVIDFDLVPCELCKRGFVTEPIMRRILSTVPESLQVDSSGRRWMGICPGCRRSVEQERIAGTKSRRT